MSNGFRLHGNIIYAKNNERAFRDKKRVCMLLGKKFLIDTALKLFSHWF